MPVPIMVRNSSRVVQQVIPLRVALRLPDHLVEGALYRHRLGRAENPPAPRIRLGTFDPADRVIANQTIAMNGLHD